MNKLFKINENDNVAIALEPLQKGYCEMGVTLVDDIPFGHKVALTDLVKGDSIVKYSNVIGSLKDDACAGSHIHDHNLKTNLSGTLTYDFGDISNPYNFNPSDYTFDGYVRDDGRVGTRNEIWVISTVGCVSKTVEELVRRTKDSCPDCDGIYGYTHPYGCSQMGDDQENTRKILSALINHPNAGGVLVVSLGCENSNVNVLKSYLGDINEDRVKFLVCQEVDDEIAEGERLIRELYSYVKGFKREAVSADKLVVGYKCGGSDAFSGITANALCGRLTDKLTSIGASAILTEVPEMFGAEHILMKRAENNQVFENIVKLINNFKNYFASHNQECYENPSPGNHDGGITTLEEKSLGCIQKGGSAVITDVLDYAMPCRKKGLSLLTGSGNDIVSITNLTASGANLILFTTGRGTPLGAPVPTVKLSSNSNLYSKKTSWIDYNAGEIINGKSFDTATNELFSLILDIASGRKTKNEINGYREISIFKDGVIM